nr:MAG TPA: minor tail protein [Caudoviricetes sp.]
MATETLSVKITANASSFSSALSKMSSDLEKATGKLDGLNKLGDGMKNVGKKLTMGLTVPIAGIAAASTNTAMNFEAAMNEVSAISGTTGKDLSKLSDLAKEMGRTTKFSASESAEALKYMSMAGWKAEDMLAGLPGILNLAAAGGTDLALTSDIVTDGLTAMGLSAKDADKFVDIMAATCSNANTSIELMGETLKYAGPVAGALGIEMDDLSVAIGLMGNAGLKGSQAGTSLRAGLTNLVKPTKEMKSAMKKYGVELVKNADGSVDLMGTMTNLRSVLGELDETTQAQALATIFGKILCHLLQKCKLNNRTKSVKTKFVNAFYREICYN